MKATLPDFKWKTNNSTAKNSEMHQGKPLSVQFVLLMKLIYISDSVIAKKIISISVLGFGSLKVFALLRRRKFNKSAFEGENSMQNMAHLDLIIWHSLYHVSHSRKERKLIIITEKIDLSSSGKMVRGKNIFNTICNGENKQS